MVVVFIKFGNRQILIENALHSLRVALGSLFTALWLENRQGAIHKLCYVMPKGAGLGVQAMCYHRLSRQFEQLRTKSYLKFAVLTLQFN